MDAFCASVNFDAAVVLRPARRTTPQNSNPERGSFVGANHHYRTNVSVGTGMTFNDFMVVRNVQVTLGMEDSASRK
jgi:hypothetical protein